MDIATIIKRATRFIAPGIILLFVVLWRFPDANADYVMLFRVLNVGVFFTIALWTCLIDLFLGIFVSLVFISALSNSDCIYFAVYWQSLFIWYLFVRHKARGIKHFIAIAILFHCSFIIIQKYWGIPFIKHADTGNPLRIPMGILFNVDASSALIAVCLPAMFNKKWVYFLPIPFFALLLVPAYGGLVAAMIAGLYFAFMVFPVNLFFLSLAACVATMLGHLIIDRPDIANRLYIWKSIIIHYKNDWLCGVGIGNLSCPVPKLGDQPLLKAHNEFLHYWVELGILAPMAFIGWFFSSMKKISPDTGAAIIACCLVSMTYFTLHDPVIAYITVTWAALASSERKKCQQPKT